MYHHDQRPYRIAVDQAAQKFQADLNAKIAASQHTALGIIERVQRDVPEDRIASSRALHFEPDGAGLRVGARGASFDQPLHRHALAQVADRAGVPDVFVTRLLGKPWGPALLSENLNQIFDREDERRLLIRSVAGQVRGVLSGVLKLLADRFDVELADIVAVEQRKPRLALLEAARKKDRAAVRAALKRLGLL